MADLVGTCPKTFWSDWLAEGDCAGEPESGEQYGWYTGDRKAATISIGDRFYIVAHGRLRGWAPVVRVVRTPGGNFIICRRGKALARTIAQPIPGFRGLRRRWWSRMDEVPFPDWRTEDIGR